MKSVENKVVIVIGTALGIGRAASFLLAQEGVKVAGIYIKNDGGCCTARLTTEHMIDAQRQMLLLQSNY